MIIYYLMSEFTGPTKFMLLKIFVADLVLKEKYVEAIALHNLKMQTDPFMDAGFDILCPSKGFHCLSNSVSGVGGPNKIDFQVKCSGQLVKNGGVDGKTSKYTGYYMYPRSSLSKTRLRLANSVGIIDSGYRGNLIGMFDCFSAGKQALCETEYDYVVKPFEKLVQICAPDLRPIFVELVESEEELSSMTSRGDGGFGSTTPLEKV
jgi:dUTP pyrophosphatase